MHQNIRGKCSVQLLNELEELKEYLSEEDTFFYTMVYDPNQKTLMVDKGEIRIGSDYQADILPMVKTCTCVCMYVCMYARMYVCAHVHTVSVCLPNLQLLKRIGTVLNWRLKFGSPIKCLTTRWSNFLL